MVWSDRKGLGMTSSGVTPVSVFVSVQARQHEADPVRGHRTEGFLVAPDLVLVPAMPREWLSDSDEYDILFVPVDTAMMQRTERIAAAFVVAHGLSQGRGPLVVFIRLTRPTTFPIFRAADCTPHQLAQALRQRHSGSSGALESDIDVLPRERGHDVEALLAQVPPTPRLEPLHGVHIHEHDSIDAVASSICEVVTWCSPPRDFAGIPADPPNNS